ncbi:MAG: hypothetical protein LBI39_04250 [Puniceicoccales bacterium]|nr:hypothetical protein [Puniceicoccales bacterium]
MKLRSFRFAAKEKFGNFFSVQEASGEMEKIDLAKFGSGPVDFVELPFPAGKVQSKK